MKGHGEVIFSWNDDVLYVETVGPFNEEGIQNAAKEYMNIINSRKDAPFSVIEIWDTESLASLQAMDKVGELWCNLAQNNCVSLAVVISSRVQSWVSNKLLPEIGKIFTKREDAQKWVEQNKNP